MVVEGGDSLFWHAAPLQYAPSILQAGCLYCADRLQALGLPIRPRRTSRRRDKRLGLSAYVHLSRTPHTPLLTDKLRRGLPHVLFAFSPAITDLPGVALVRYNAASWRHREDFAPVTDPTERATLLADHRKRYPSLALLVPGDLSLLPHAIALHCSDANAAAFIGGLVALTGLPGGLPIRITPAHFPATDAVPEYTPFHAYVDACHAAGRLLPPPSDLPID